MHLVLDLLEVDNVSVLLTDAISSEFVVMVGLVEALPVVLELRGLRGKGQWLSLGLDLDLDSVGKLVLVDSILDLFNGTDLII